MAYTRTNWVEEETPLSAQNLNNIEDGIEELQAQKVDKASGKALSDNNYTTAEKTKLAGIETGAEVNRTYTAVSGYPTSNVAPGFGQTAAVSQVSQDVNGQITLTHRTITIPNKVATTAAPGLMSAADKQKLNKFGIGSVIVSPRNDSDPIAPRGQFNFICDASVSEEYDYAILISSSLVNWTITKYAPVRTGGLITSFSITAVNVGGSSARVRKTDKLTFLLIKTDV